VLFAEELNVHNGARASIGPPHKALSYSPSLVLAFLADRPPHPGTRPLHLLSQPHRARRLGEWTPGKAVTFIVTLAATRNVTLAARAAGMSRKSAYALKSRDSVFADAWGAATNAPAQKPVEGDTPVLVRPSTSSTVQCHPDRRLLDAARRDRFFARLAALNGESAPLAAVPAAQ
jgi:hypothetical protein